jgi:hypothetical protein
LRESACLASDHLGLELNLDNRNTLQASGFNVSENIMDTQKIQTTGYFTFSCT